MKYDYAMERADLSRIDKLNNLVSADTFWDDVRRLTRSVKGDHGLRRWECLADARYAELKKGVDIK